MSPQDRPASGTLADPSRRTPHPHPPSPGKVACGLTRVVALVTLPAQQAADAGPLREERTLVKGQPQAPLTTGSVESALPNEPHGSPWMLPPRSHQGSAQECCTMVGLPWNHLPNTKLLPHYWENAWPHTWDEPRWLNPPFMGRPGGMGEEATHSPPPPPDGYVKVVTGVVLLELCSGLRERLGARS